MNIVLTQVNREIVFLITLLVKVVNTYIHVPTALSKQSGQLSISTCVESFRDNFSGSQSAGEVNYIYLISRELRVFLSDLSRAVYYVTSSWCFLPELCSKK